MKKAVCLLSGGLDSTTALYAACHEGYQVTALTLQYGQRHRKEINSARDIAQHLDIPFWVVPITLPWGGSSLLNRQLEIPMNRSENEMTGEIPSTYVPARNSIFLTMAASLAETIDAEALFIGANAVDYSGYPDCRPEYFEAFQKMIQLATKKGVNGGKIEIYAPLLRLSKKAIVLLGDALGVPFEKTWSCYLGNETPCGRCDSCTLRQNGFAAARIEDPLTLHAQPVNA